jgi:hypothetical protein
MFRGGKQVDRDQLDVQVTEQLERAVQPGLIEHPSHQVRQAVLDASDFEAIEGGNESRAQPSSDY